MNESNENFRKLIEYAMAVSREGTEQARATPDFADAMKMLASKHTRLELRISFNPMPAVVGELIRDEDGELIGELFRQEARFVPTN